MQDNTYTYVYKNINKQEIVNFLTGNAGFFDNVNENLYLTTIQRIYCSDEISGIKDIIPYLNSFSLNLSDEVIPPQTIYNYSTNDITYIDIFRYYKQTGKIKIIIIDEDKYDSTEIISKIYEILNFILNVDVNYFYSLFNIGRIIHYPSEYYIRKEVDYNKGILNQLLTNVSYNLSIETFDYIKLFQKASMLKNYIISLKITNGIGILNQNIIEREILPFKKINI